MIDLSASLRVYLVADPHHARGELRTTVESALRGGVTMVQLRSKQLSDRELLESAHIMRELCWRFDVGFLVNDRVDIALAVNADGVHLGVDDLSITAAKELGGPDFVVGYSPESDEQLRNAKSLGADYLGVGPVFETTSKLDAGGALGLEEFHRRVQLGNLPAVGIGGITTENASSVLGAGAAGVAVIAAVLQANDPESAAHQLSRNS